MINEEKVYCSMYSRNAELYHHGIKGQKWGVTNGPPYPLSDEVSDGKALKKQKKYLKKISKDTKQIENVYSNYININKNKYEEIKKMSDELYSENAKYISDYTNTLKKLEFTESEKKEIMDEVDEIIKDSINLIDWSDTYSSTKGLTVDDFIEESYFKDILKYSVYDHGEEKMERLMHDKEVNLYKKQDEVNTKIEKFIENYADKYSDIKIKNKDKAFYESSKQFVDRVINDLEAKNIETRNGPKMLILNKNLEEQDRIEKQKYKELNSQFTFDEYKRKYPM